MLKRGYDMFPLKVIIEKLMYGDSLSSKNHVHLLKGIYTGMFECHIEPDWLLIYYYDYDNQIIVLVDTGTHSDLF